MSDIVHEDISLAVRANTSTSKEEFLLYAIGVLVNGEEFDDFIEWNDTRYVSPWK